MGRALLCLVTDRRRLAARMGADVAAAADLLLAQMRAAADAGVDLVQIREPDLPARQLVLLTRRTLDALAGSRTRVVVNDRLDVAIASGAHGVHLKAGSPSPARVRHLLPEGALVGVSVHDPRAAADAAGADYLIAGTVRATPSKPDGWPLLGLGGLGRIVEAAGGVPVLGIGGLAARDARALREAGASGLAGIDAFLPSDARGFPGTVHESVILLRMVFDSPEHVS